MQKEWVARDRFCRIYSDEQCNEKYSFPVSGYMNCTKTRCKCVDFFYMENDVHDENLVEEHMDDKNRAHDTYNYTLSAHIHFTLIDSSGKVVKGAPIRQLVSVQNSRRIVDDCMDLEREMMVAAGLTPQVGKYMDKFYDDLLKYHDSYMPKGEEKNLSLYYPIITSIPT